MAVSQTVLRSRLPYLLAALAVVGSGLASRWLAGALPWLGKYPGDALWTVLVFLLWGVALPRASSAAVLLLAVSTSFLVEASQLLTEPWLVSLRRTTFGHLVLGSTFNAPDLVAYSVGGLVAYFVEASLLRSRMRGKRSNG